MIPAPAPRSNDFGPIAVQVADWWLDHQSPLSAAPWDFDDPAGPDAAHDTSASAIAACALLKLAALRPETAARYLPAATQTLTSLAARHLTPLHPDDTRPPGMLLDGCYDHGAGWADAHELIWGDYFFLEAVLTLTTVIDATAI